jgi:hypothetical protein
MVLVGCDIPKAEDQAEATKVENAIEARYHFRVMSFSSKRPAVYESPHVHYSEIQIFGDYTSTEQDAIVKIARAVRQEVAKKPVWISFYPMELVEENLTRREKIE